jgi:beta-glucosidase
LQVPEQARAGSPVKVSVDVKNSGKRAGEEVVQLYIKHPGVVRELQGFSRISLTPGQNKTVEFPLTRPEAGDIQIQVGGLVKSCRISP